MSADPDKVEAIKAMKRLCNVSETRRFLGMVNHLGKFLPHLTEKTQPLRLIEKVQHVDLGITSARGL